MHCPVKILIIIIILLPTCRSSDRSRTGNLSGKPGEVLIVMSDDAWNGSPGASCRDLFGKAYEMLPQYEPVFDFTHIDFGSYRDFFLLHRNILVAEISSDISEASMVVQKDHLAASQLVITLLAPDDSSFLQLMAENGDRILAMLDEAERQRIIDSNKKNIDQSLAEIIRSRFGISLVLPKGYDVALDTTGFMWLRMEEGSVILGILVYQGKFETLLGDPSLQNLVRSRDEMLKQFIPGSVPGSYMTTEKEFRPVLKTYSPEDKTNLSEMRGLWKMENDISMGGPFISLTRQNNQDSIFITVEGFVYAAGFSKRNYMRKLEAIIY